LGRVGRARKDTADTSTIVSTCSGDVNVTLNTPLSTPRVLDDPSTLIIVGSVTNSSNSVVKRSTAILGNDTTRVQLEDILVSFNTNKSGLLGNSSHQSVGVIGTDISVTSILENDIRSIVLASSVGASEGVVSERFNTLLRGIDEGVVKVVTSVASRAGGGTIDQLLFRERGKLVSLDEPERFKTGSSSERPASTALTLVLNGGDGSLLSPINRGGDRGSFIEGDGFLGSVGEDHFFTVHAVSGGGEFFVGQVSEDGKTKDGSGVLSVILNDEVVVIDEGVVSLLLFSIRGVGLAHLLFPGLPEISKVLALSGNGEDSEKDSEGFHLENQRLLRLR